jgi:hypothetical protein
MGHIKEPKGVDLLVSPMPFTAEDRKAISDIIAAYRLTGEVPKPKKEPKKDKPAKRKNSLLEKVS